jgi:hypothetical protein
MRFLRFKDKAARNSSRFKRGKRRKVDRRLPEEIIEHLGYEVKRKNLKVRGE